MMTIEYEDKYNDGGVGGNDDMDVCILFSNSGAQNVCKKDIIFLCY